MRERVGTDIRWVMKAVVRGRNGLKWEKKRMMKMVAAEEGG